MAALGEETRKVGKATQGIMDPATAWRSGGHAGPGGSVYGPGDSHAFDPTGQNVTSRQVRNGGLPASGPPGRSGYLGTLGKAAVGYAAYRFWGQGMDYLDQNRFNPNASVGGMVTDSLMSLPILSQINEVYGGGLGTDNGRTMYLEAANRIGKAEPYQQLNAQLAGIRNAGEMSLLPLDVQQRNLAADQRAATRTLNSFNANPSAYYTEDRLGVSTSQTGALKLAATGARIEADVAGESARDAKDAVRAQQAKVAAAEAAVRAAGGEFSGRAGDAYTAEQRMKNKFSGLVDPAMFEANRRTDRESAAAVSNRDAASNAQQVAQVELDHQRQILNDKIKTSMEAQSAAAQKNYDAAKAEAEVLRDQLAIAEKKKSTLQSGAEQFAMMNQGQRDSLLSSLNAYRRGGWESLDSEQKQEIRGFAPFGEEYQTIARQSARSNPQYSQALGLAGVSGTLDQARDESKQLALEFSRKQLEANANFRTELTAALVPALDALRESIKKAITDGIDAANTKFQRDMNAAKAKQVQGVAGP